MEQLTDDTTIGDITVLGIEMQLRLSPGGVIAAQVARHGQFVYTKPDTRAPRKGLALKLELHDGSALTVTDPRSTGRITLDRDVVEHAGL